MKRILMLLLILCSIHFWRYYSLSQRFHNLTDLVSLLIMGVSFVKVLQEKDLRFKNAIILCFIGVFCNILSAYFNNGQGIKDTLLSFGPFYFILFYFYLHDNKYSLKEIEIIIIVFAALYSAIYLYQSHIFPRQLFGGAMFRDRGTIRIKLEGNGFLMLAYFMMLNRYLLNRKLINIIIAMFFFLVLLKGGFRTLTAGAVLFTGVIFIRLVKYSPTNYFLIIVAVVMFLGLLSMDSTSRIIYGMVNASQQQQEQGERYIRRMQLLYFTREYPDNFSYYIFGGGLPGGEGNYASQMSFLASEFGYYWADLGLLGFYFIIGFVALVGLLWYTLLSIFLKVPPEGIYLGIYFGYLLVVSTLTGEIYRSGIFVVEAIGLYLIDMYRNRWPLLNKNNGEVQLNTII